MSTVMEKPPTAAPRDEVVSVHGTKRPHRLLTIALQVGVFAFLCAVWQGLADGGLIDTFFFSRPSTSPRRYGAGSSAVISGRISPLRWPKR